MFTVCQCDSLEMNGLLLPILDGEEGEFLIEKLGAENSCG